MFGPSKCPKCEKDVRSLEFDELEAGGTSGPVKWRALAFRCPSCNTILGAQIDPLAVQDDPSRGRIR